MKFTQEFKKRVYDLLLHETCLSEIMFALEKDDDLTVRLNLELLIDTYQAELKPKIIDDFELLEWNDTVVIYYQIYKLYSEFMEMYIQEIDYLERVLAEKDLNGN